MENSENSENLEKEDVHEQLPIDVMHEPVQDLGERFKEIAEQMMGAFHQRIDALDKKYTDLRHTLTRQVDTPTFEELEDWSWEHLRETMFPRETVK